MHTTDRYQANLIDIPSLIVPKVATARSWLIVYCNAKLCPVSDGNK